MNIGFLVNPIACMGGSLGLKGTDDDALDRAIAMGGIYIAERRAGIALQRLSDKKKTKEGISFKFFTCSDVMGENILKKVGFDYKVVYTVKSEKTTYKDTCEACRRFMDKKVDIILFCGGDGTAKDVYSVTKKDLPILGIPSGVKMYSSVFAIDPTVAGDLLSEFCRKDNDIVLRDAEIVDIDEEEYRTRGDISIDIIGYATTIYKPFFVQDRKTIFYGNNEERCRRDIAKFISEVMLDGILYIIGPGNTTKSVTDELNIKKTMLGVDIIKDGSSPT